MHTNTGKAGAFKNKRHTQHPPLDSSTESTAHGQERSRRQQGGPTSSTGCRAGAALTLGGACNRCAARTVAASCEG